jgi:hypothetical protein
LFVTLRINSASLMPTQMVSRTLRLEACAKMSGRLANDACGLGLKLREARKKDALLVQLFRDCLFKRVWYCSAPTKGAATP